MSDPFFDTNILIDWLFDRPPAVEELARYERHRISRVVWAELLAGEPIATRDRVKHLIRRFEVIEVDAQVAELAADIRHRTRVKLIDCFILATARANDAILVTRNTKDFPPETLGVRIPYTI